MTRSPSRIPWAPAAVRGLLDDYGRTPSQLDIVPLEGWPTNLILLVEADGERLVLRVYGTTPREEVQWELALLERLRKHDFPTVRPLRRTDGETLGTFQARPAILYPFIEGRNGCQPGTDRRDAMLQTASIIGRLHLLTLGPMLPFPRQRSGSDSMRLFGVLRSWAEARGVQPNEPALTRFVGDVAAAECRLRAGIGRWRHDLPHGVVHRDAHCANVLFHEGRLVALIDFDDACPGHLVADLAVLLEQWAVDPEHRFVPEHAAALLETYQRIRRLTPSERALLPDFCLAYLLSDACASVLGDVEQGVPAERAAANCAMYHRYRRDLADPAWRSALQRLLASAVPYAQYRLGENER